MREFCTSGSAGGPGGVIPWGYPTYISVHGTWSGPDQFHFPERINNLYRVINGAS